MLELTKLCKEYNLVVILETNGTLIDEDFARRAHKLELDLIGVSLDHVNCTIHEWFRGASGIYDRVLYAIKTLKMYGLNVQVIVTVNKTNINDVVKISNFVLEDLGVNLKLVPVMPLGKALQNPQILLSPEDYLLLRDIGLKLVRKYSVERVFISLPPSLLSPEEVEYLCACNYKQRLSIFPDGTVSFCGIAAKYRELICGSVLAEDLERILSSSSVLSQLRSISGSTVEGVCRYCKYADICCNNCPAEVYVHYGSFFKSYPLCQKLFECGLFPKTALRNTDEE